MTTSTPPAEPVIWRCSAPRAATAWVAGVTVCGFQLGEGVVTFHVKAKTWIKSYVDESGSLRPWGT